MRLDAPVRAVVSMPEAAIDVDGSVSTWHHDVGRAWQFGAVQAKSQASRVQISADGKFRGGILAADPLHQGRSLLGRSEPL